MNITPFTLPEDDGANSSLDPAVFTRRAEQFLANLKGKCENEGVKVRLVPASRSRPACLLFTDPHLKVNKKKLTKIEHVNALNDYLVTYANGFSDTLKTLKLMMGEKSMLAGDGDATLFVLDHANTDTGTFSLSFTHNLRAEDAVLGPDVSFTAQQFAKHIEQHTNPVYLFAKLLKDRGVRVIGDTHLAIDPSMAEVTVDMLGPASQSGVGRA